MEDEGFSTDEFRRTRKGPSRCPFAVARPSEADPWNASLLRAVGRCIASNHWWYCRLRSRKKKLLSMMLLVYVQDLKDPIPQNIFPCTCGFRTIQDTNSLERRLQMLIDHDPEKKKKKKTSSRNPRNPKTRTFTHLPQWAVNRDIRDSGDPIPLTPISTCRITFLSNSSIFAGSRKTGMTDPASYSLSRMKYRSRPQFSTVSRWNAILAMILAGTVALLMALLENTRRKGPSPDRVWWAMRTDRGAAVVRWLSPVKLPGSRVKMLSAMLPD